MGKYTVKSFEGKLVLAATIFASGMAFLDGSVVNIAIPVMQSALNASLDGMQWVVNSYALLLAALILISGSLGDKFGRKKVFLYGIGLFVISSFLCSIASSIEQLIAFRSLQGIGAAMMIPGSLSIINTAFAESEHGAAIGLWSGFAGGVASIGPFIGGWLVQTFGWPSIFLINIPIGILAIFLTVRYVPESKNEDAKHLDIVGTVLLFVGLLGISYALIEAPVFGLLNALVISSFLLGIVAIVGFVYAEKKVKEPLFSFHIFNSPLVIGANIVTLFLYFALSGVIFFLILNFQQFQQYSPLIAGISLLPAILLITFLSGPAGSLSDKIGPRLPMIIGPLLVSIGMFTLIIPGKGANFFLTYLPGLLLFGLGMACVIAPLTKSALSVDPKYSGAASGVNNAVSRTAALLAVALLGAIMATMFSSHLIKDVTSSSLTQSQKQQIIAQKNRLGGITIPQSFDGTAKHTAQVAIDESFLYSFRVIIGIAASLALLSSFVSFLLIHNPKKK
jgi:EmrB/QacA subfamily drug resistance transporter